MPSDSNPVGGYLQHKAEGLSVLQHMRTAKIIAVDTETNAQDVRDGRGFARGVSVAFVTDDGAFTHYYPFRHATGENYGQRTLGLLREGLESASALIFHNAQFDIPSLATLDIDVFGIWFLDTMVAAQLINENWPMRKGLDECAHVYLGESGKNTSPELEKEKKLGFPTWPASEVKAYAETDAVSTWRLGREMLPMLDEEAGREYWYHKQRLINVLIVMESRGVLVNPALALELAEKGEGIMSELRTAMGINPGSRNDLESVLIGKLGFPIVKASAKTGAPSFDKFAMQEYDALLDETDDPFGRQLREYRGWSKSVGTYYRPYIERRSPDGRVRCEFRLDTTVTGRFSCTNPNLQQIPKVTDKPWNGRVKECFVPREGYVLVEVDYSQLELRLATAYANEPHLKAVFSDPLRDVFDEMAAALEMVRNDCKTLTYSMQYGAGLNRLMTAFRVSKERAEEIRSNYFNTYPAFKALAEKCDQLARKEGKIRMWSGRARHFRNPKEESYKAMNSLIQGGAADIMEMTMVRLFDEVDSDDCRMLLQVHDAIVFEIKAELEDTMVPQIIDIMSDVQGTCGKSFNDVRFAVDAHRWGGTL